MVVETVTVLRPLYNAVPLVLVMECWLKGRLDLKPWLGPALLMWLFWCVSAVLRLGKFDSEFVFTAVSLLVLAQGFKVNPRHIRLLLGCQVAAAIILGLSRGGISLDVTNQFQAESAQSSSESSIGLASALIVLLAYIRRMPVLGVIALLITLLFGKRIALIGIVAGVGLDLFATLALGHLRRGFGTIATAALGVGMATLGVNAASFYRWLSVLLSEEFSFNISPNALSSGRYNGINAFEQFMAIHQSLITSIIGHGTGFTTSVLSMSLSLKQSQTYKLLHDDWLRIMTDYGLIGLAAIIGGFCLLAWHRRLGLPMAVYTIVVMASDNVLTYAFYWITFAICLNYSPNASAQRKPVHKPGGAIQRPWPTQPIRTAANPGAPRNG
ncbi:hypothetical protein [Novosphingobium decolorationis]|uniref:O-antigen ligase domain-containing protein n=1 Tax=Novosphingobium decolorationis TaxID=2698673 RepID=A0ABX8E442_9SPHN|nr:hypothetical protein [Novosphingobium decolorationis]QVM83708.1 hypothetical protein HT578_08360 [Novosphingobium decolorationis]